MQIATLDVASTFALGNALRKAGYSAQEQKVGHFFCVEVSVKETKSSWIWPASHSSVTKFAKKEKNSWKSGKL